MNGYLPFNANHSSIYEEYQTAGETIEVKTVALDYLSNLYESLASIVILTGDAGHGKTHLCRRFLEESMGYKEVDARQLINNSCNGKTLIPHVGKVPKRPVNIYKDLSELTDIESIESIEKAYVSKEVLTIICANEGKLRAVLSAGANSQACKEISTELSNHFENGVTSISGRTHIINLNYQSIASCIKSESNLNSLVFQAFKSWMDGRKWSVCGNCSVQKNCPIFRNYDLLSETRSGLANKRLQRIGDLLSAAEQLGDVITIREMLMLVSYIVTGGLNCREVHKQKNKIGWQNEFAFYNLLFQTPGSLSNEAVKSIPILAKLQVLDPGTVSSRRIDERLLNSTDLFPEDQLDLKFRSADNQLELVDAANGVDEIIGNPTSKKERLKEAELTIKIVRSLRRRAYFEAIFDELDATTQLGFKHGEQFTALLTGELKGAELSRAKRRIINGLHTIQGIVGKSSITNLFLVDPAFGSSTQHAAIISRSIQPSEIKLVPMRDKWKKQDSAEDYAIKDSVDWIDRFICFRVKDVSRRDQDFPLDLLTFNTICVAADGFVSESFFTHDLRRIKNYLARLCESDPTKQTDIKVIVEGSIQSVSIDDGVIQVGGSS